MPGKNTQYRGPEIMIQLLRTTNIPWQVRSMRNGYLISNAQYRERYRPADADWRMLYAPVEADVRFSHVGERGLRNLHSQSSRKTSGAYEAPHSKYVSMTSSMTETGWGEGLNPSFTFRFNIWRSDVWKGSHDLTRDPALYLWLVANLFSLPLQERWKTMIEQTPADWDRGSEFEWLALGGTKIYNVQETTDGVHWADSQPTAQDIDFWWEAI